MLNSPYLIIYTMKETSSISVFNGMNCLDIHHGYGYVKDKDKDSQLEKIKESPLKSNTLFAASLD